MYKIARYEETSNEILFDYEIVTCDSLSTAKRLAVEIFSELFRLCIYDSEGKLVASKKELSSRWMDY